MKQNSSPRATVGLSGGPPTLKLRKGKRRLKVAVGLSGGVDSAVSAVLLKEQGYEVTGVFLECWRAPGCRVDEDRKDAMDVALKLAIPFQVLDFKEAYREKVVDYFYREYAAGRTPNPDVMCNREIKFGLFYEWARAHRYDFVATGHYARVATHHSLRGNAQTAYSAVSQAGSYGGQAGHYARICERLGGGNFLAANGSVLKSTPFIEADQVGSLANAADKIDHPSLDSLRSVNRNFVDLSAQHYRLLRGRDKKKDPHFARLSRATRGKQSYQLLRGSDSQKDQSYFLYQLRQEQLGHILFPVGNLTKVGVRKEAKKRRLPVADKPDSQGICFIGEVSVKQFLKELGMKEKRGKVVIKVPSSKFQVQNKSQISSSNSQKNISAWNLELGNSGNYVVIGSHDGVGFYTVGQRIGLEQRAEGRVWRRLGFDPSQLPPLYVVDKDVGHNRLVVGTREQAQKRQFEVRDLNWLIPNSQLPIANKQLRVRIRHLGELIKVRKVREVKEGLRVTLARSAFGVAPGQAAVFYNGEVVLGGGVIDN